MAEGEIATAEWKTVALTRAIVTLGFVIRKTAEITGDCAIPGEKFPVFGYVTAMALPRAITTVEAVHTLLSQRPPFGADALPVVRSLWELVITLEYIADDEAEIEERAIRYLAFFATSNRRQLEWRRANPGQFGAPTPVQEASVARDEAQVRKTLVEHFERRGMDHVEAQALAAERLSAWAKNKRRWNGLTIEDTAKAIHATNLARTKQYRHDYMLLSEYSHAGIGSLMPYSPLVSRDELDEIVDADPNTEPALLASGMAVIWFLQLHVLVADTFGLNWGKTLYDLYLAAEDQWKRGEVFR